jgi:hypothetical protein
MECNSHPSDRLSSVHRVYIHFQGRKVTRLNEFDRCTPFETSIGRAFRNLRATALSPANRSTRLTQMR